MFRSSALILALAMPGALFAQGTPEQAYAAAVRAGACAATGGIASATWDGPNRVRVVCNAAGFQNAGAAAGAGAVVMLALLADGSSSTTTTDTGLE